MKNLFIIAIILQSVLIAIACDPIDPVDASRSDRQRAYAHYCTEAIWSNPRIAGYNGMTTLSHREVYDACAEDYNSKPRMIVLEIRVQDEE